MNITSKALLFACLFGAVLLQGCGATKIKASSTNNPPPAEAFSAFGRIEVRPVVFGPDVKPDPDGLNKIEANIQMDLSASLLEWNARKANGRSLVIQPVIEQMSFKRGAKRIFLGPLAGSSGVLLRLKITDNKGRTVASPEFFQRASAMSAGFTLGARDNLMLTRVANLASAYVITNYRRAEGGATGADDEAVAQ
ncbi:hypothetical protein INH39_09580 [Massilia violaceinigra]|uniref:DUF4410 domain-containing protein n=1 Tax=Massilia violaceinigra TaxID=2045208 RepID=A0ABY4AAQ0_9BURK|nr:hypothetical protein [Massilia violaceinigra]UOD31893.1 hypothetical protein INH39_09580 [Massilia violaceinigra]